MLLLGSLGTGAYGWPWFPRVAGVCQLQAHLFCCSPSFLPLGGGLCRGVARCCLARVALPVVGLQGYGGAARLCRRCILVTAEHVVALPTLSSAPYVFGHFQIPSFFHTFCPPCFCAYAPFVVKSCCSVLPHLVTHEGHWRKHGRVAVGGRSTMPEELAGPAHVT